jgi:hypothetical protein
MIDAARMIMEQIDKHRRAYENMGEDVPPYRILMNEYYLLKNECRFDFKMNNILSKAPDPTDSQIDEFMGVKFIIVDHEGRKQRNIAYDAICDFHYIHRLAMAAMEKFSKL